MTKDERDLRIRIFKELIADLPRPARLDGARCIDLIDVREWLREKRSAANTVQAESPFSAKPSS
jgi:hypothetical protein